MKWNSAYMDIIKQCYIFVMEYLNSAYVDVIVTAFFCGLIPTKLDNTYEVSRSYPKIGEPRSSWTGQKHVLYF